MYKRYIAVAIVLNSHILCCAQVILFGDCTHVDTVEYFEIERFLGKWYTIQRFPSWYEENGECSYKLLQQCGRAIEMQHRFIKYGFEYVLHINTTYAPGDAAVFHFPNNNIDPASVPLSVIRTDYTNYAVIFGCKYNATLNIKYVLAWILSRDTSLPREILDDAYKLLNAIPGVNQAYFETISHSEESCSYRWTAHVQATYYNDTRIFGTTV